MPDPQEFSRLFTELKDEVADLDKRRADLKGGIITLEARETYLKDAIEKLEAERLATSTAGAEKIEKLNKKLEHTTKQFVDAESTLATLRSDYQTVNGQLLEQQEALRASVEALQTELDAKTQEVIGLKADQVDLDVEIETLEKAATVKKLELTNMQTEVDERRIKTDRILAEIKGEETIARQKIKDLKAKADNVSDDIEDSEITLKDVESKIKKAQEKHAKYFKYEEQSKAALKAREDSLLAREHELDLQTITSRRRNRVLGNTP